MKFEYTKVMNLEGAIRGMRNPLESHNKSDSGSECIIKKNKMLPNLKKGYVVEEEFTLGEKDKRLALKLAKAGSDHGKFLRQIFVNVDISGPWLWWKEYATYKVGTVENSTSMMHTLGKRRLTEDDFGWDYMTKFRETYLAHLNDLIDTINSIDKEIKRTKKRLKLNKNNPDKVKSITKLISKANKEKKTYWRELNQDMSGAYIYKRTCTLNYEVIRNMYFARKGHKLNEWAVDFKEWVELLPYSELITINRKKE